MFIRRLILRNIFIFSLAFICLSISGQSTYGTFRNWDFTPTRVFGITKLTDTAGRQYCIISPVDDNNVKIEWVNPKGIITKTSLVTFSDTKISRISAYNQWGYNDEVWNFTSLGNDEFMVTDHSKGENELLPCKAQKYIYKNGLLVEVRNTGFDDQVCKNADGVAIERYTRYEDDNKYSLIKEDAFYDELGAPVTSRKEDCHKIVYERDERGNELSKAYFGNKGQPVTNRNGGHKTVKVFDKRDNQIECKEVGLSGKVISDPYGVAKTKNEYKGGLKTKTTFYNLVGDIARESDAGSGVAITIYQYDNKGNQVRESYFDEAGKPMNNPEGIHETADKYSEQNMLMATDYFDKDGQPTTDREGIHRYTYLHDSYGRVTQKAFYDKFVKPVANQFDKVCMFKYKFDSLGRRASQSYWQNKSTKMRRWDDYHELTYKYNAEGQETETICRDENGNEIPATSGYSKTVTIYNANCLTSELLRFNGDKPAVMKKGTVRNYHSVRLFYDAENRVTRIEYFDRTGNPVNAFIDIGDGINCHKIELTYIGESVATEKFYPLDSNTPSKIIDCVKNDYVKTWGVSVYVYKK